MASSARPRSSANEKRSPSPLVRAGLTFGGAIAAASILTAGTQLALARLLRPSEYSLLVTLFIVITVAGVPLGGLQASVARQVAAAFESGGVPLAGVAVRAASRALIRLTVPAAIVACAAAVPLALVLEVRRPWPLVATGATIAASIGLTVVLGGLQGAHRFIVLSWTQVGFALLKLVAAVTAAAAGASVGGVMTAVAAATFVTLALAAVPLAPYLRASAHAAVERVSIVTRYSGNAGAALTLFAVMTTLDVLVARVTLRPALAGAYAAASVLARALLVIPTAVTTVLFPTVSTLRDRARERRHLLGGVVSTLATCLPITAVIWLQAPRILDVIFGSRYAPAANWVGPLSLAMSFYAVAFVYLFHVLSLGRTDFALLASPVMAFQAGAFVLFHGSGDNLVAVQLAAALGLALAGVAIDRRRRA